MRRTSFTVLTLIVLTLLFTLPATALIWSPPPPTPSPVPSPVPSESETPSIPPSATPTSSPEESPVPAPTESVPAEPAVLRPTISHVFFHLNNTVLTFGLKDYDGVTPLILEYSFQRETGWSAWPEPVTVEPPYLSIPLTLTPEITYYFHLAYEDGTHSNVMPILVRSTLKKPNDRPNTGDTDGSDREPQPQPPKPVSPSPTASAQAFSEEQSSILRSRLEQLQSFWTNRAWLPPFYSCTPSPTPSVSVPAPALTVELPAPSPSQAPQPTVAAAVAIAPPQPTSIPSPAPSPAPSPIPVSTSVAYIPDTDTPLPPEAAASPVSAAVESQPQPPAPSPLIPALIFGGLFLLSLSACYFFWFKRQ